MITGSKTADSLITVPLDLEALRLLKSLPKLLSDGDSGQLVTVMHVQGSAPRAPGARMLCRDGRLLGGTIGGGHLEDKALRYAAELATKPGFERLLRRYQLGPELAQCCGGVVELMFEPVDQAKALQLATATDNTQRAGVPLVSEAGGRTLVETPAPVATVVIFGAGHVGAALAQVLAALPWRIVVVDQRAEWADPARFMPTVQVLNRSPVAVLGSWGWLGEEALASAKSQTAQTSTDPAPQKDRTCAVIMTHDHGVDRDLADALLRVDSRTDGRRLRYVGVIGSKTKIAMLRRRLGERGVTDEQLDALVAPIGIRHDGELLGGKLPGEIAISVAAQLLAVMQ